MMKRTVQGKVRRRTLLLATNVSGKKENLVEYTEGIQAQMRNRDILQEDKGIKGKDQKHKQYSKDALLHDCCDCVQCIAAC